METREDGVGSSPDSCQWGAVAGCALVQIGRPLVSECHRSLRPKTAHTPNALLPQDSWYSQDQQTGSFRLGGRRRKTSRATWAMPAIAYPSIAVDCGRFSTRVLATHVPRTYHARTTHVPRSNGRTDAWWGDVVGCCSSWVLRVGTRGAARGWRSPASAGRRA